MLYKYTKSQDSRLKFPGARSPDSLTWCWYFFLSRFTFRFHLAVFITEMFLFLSETNPLFLENKKENWQESLFFKTSFLYRRDFFIPGCMVLWLSDPFFRLEESFRDTGFDQNTVQNSGNKQNFFDGIRELTASLEERFAKVLARDTVLANKPVFWQKFGMRNQSSKKKGKYRIRALLPDPEGKAMGNGTVFLPLQRHNSWSVAEVILPSHLSFHRFTTS